MEKDRGAISGEKPRGVRVLGQEVPSSCEPSTLGKPWAKQAFGTLLGGGGSQGWGVYPSPGVLLFILHSILHPHGNSSLKPHS